MECFILVVLRLLHWNVYAHIYSTQHLLCLHQSIPDFLQKSHEFYILLHNMSMSVVDIKITYYVLVGKIIEAEIASG